MVQNGPNDHFGQNGLILNWILAFARPKWTKMVHFGPFWPEEVHLGPFRSANRTLATPDKQTGGNDICVATGIAVRCRRDARCRQCTGKRLSRSNLVVLQQGEDVAFV